jgi:RNA-directed DNA polymerase
MPHEIVPNLATCETNGQLATALGVDPGILELLASDQAQAHYRRHSIPKRSNRRKGEHRVVFEPATEELRQVHKTLARRLTLYASQADPSFPAACSFGYRRHKSIKDNAIKHCGARLLLRADIQNCFPSVLRTRVESLLIRLKVPKRSSALLSRIFCFDGSLVLGLSGSPLLANLACHDLDGRLTELAATYSATYTRYADDLAFSGLSLPSRAEISGILETEGFSLSETKLRITKSGQSHFVTGLSISDPCRPHVPKKLKRRLRQEIYYCNKFGIDEHFIEEKQSVRSGLNRLDGTVNYVSFIERDTSYDYRVPWESLLARDDKRPTFAPRHDREPTQKYCVIDESIVSIGAGRYMTLAWAIFSDLGRIEAVTKKVLDAYLSDPFSAGRKADIQKDGLHFVAAHAELKNQFISELPILTFRCYVVLKRYHEDDEYSTIYFDLLKWALVHVYKSCDRENLKISVEQNTHISRPDIEHLFRHGYTLFQQAGIKRPLIEPTVEIVSKKSLSVSIPDFMLGVLGGFMQTPREDGSVAYVQFERLRDRYSLIYDLDKKTAYSRRHPIHVGSLTQSEP